MTDPKPHGIYGEIPRDLLEIPADVQQFSPLIVGSAQMKNVAEGSLESFTVYAPPGTLERRYVLARALSTLAPGAPFTALAPKDKGGSRLADELKNFGCNVTSDSRAHHRIVTTARPAQLQGIEEAIAAGGAQQLNGFWTHPGVFSWDRIDAGSALLLKHLPAFSGSGADLGCGIGVLARSVLTSPAVTSLLLVDIDRRAVDMAKQNIEDTRAHFRWADMRASELPARELDFIVMNPPFHDSGIEDKTLGQSFITRAATMLKNGGELWFVGNRHLPYETLLKHNFSQFALVSETDLYKIFKAVK